MDIKEVLRGFALLAFAIVSVLVLFIFHYAFTVLHPASSQPITGQIVAVDNQHGSEQEVIITPPPQGGSGPGGISSESIPEQDLFASGTMQCWKRHGVSVEDAIVLGELLEKAPCASDIQKKKVQAKIVNNCLNLDIANELYALLCIEDQQPTFAIDFPTGLGVAPPIVLVKSYNSAILFLLFLLSLLLLWGRFEISAFRERMLKRSIHFGDGEVVAIKYIRPAPLFGGPPQPRPVSLEEIEKTHKKLLEERSVSEARELERVKLKSEEINEYIKEFNALAKEANEQLQSNRVEDAEKLYLALFPLYTRLYNTLDESSKAELQIVVKYLHDQVHLALKEGEIRGLIEQAYREAESHRVDRNETPSDARVLSELDRFRDLIEKNKLEEAKKVFGRSGGDRSTKEKLVASIETLRKSLEDSDSRVVKKAKKELTDVKKLVDKPH